VAKILANAHQSPKYQQLKGNRDCESKKRVSITAQNDWCDVERLKLQCIAIATFLVLTALHAMQTRSSDENSVRLSVKCVHCDKTEERSVKIFIPYERSFSLVF